VTRQSEAIFPIRYATATIDEVFKLTVAAPGLSREDFDVTLTKGRNLIVKTVRPEDVENKNEFSFSYQLYDDQDADAIYVKMQNGLLELSIPKLTCDPKTEVERKIEIDG
jgi:HSP20 family protein